MHQPDREGLGQHVLLYGEVSLGSLRARPDFGVDVGGRQAGIAPTGSRTPMAEFTDQVLKKPMGLPRGSASDEVIAVDPAMGAGTFLVEILRSELRMHRALQSYKTEVPESSSRYLADTLDDPNARVLDYLELYEDFRNSREGANRVKLHTQVIVVITNPPWRERRVATPLSLAGGKRRRA
jgi:hypothetical protein